ncbi:unnamed protein product, partial [Amoebophrya sp. A25]
EQKTADGEDLDGLSSTSAGSALQEQLWTAHVQTRGLHRRAISPSYSTAVYRDEYGDPLQYVHLEGNTRDLTWVPICPFNRSHPSQAESPEATKSSRQRTGTVAGVRRGQCEYYTEGQTNCMYELTPEGVKYLDRLESILEETTSTRLSSSTSTQQTSTPASDEAGAAITTSLLDYDALFRPVDFNNCEIPHLHAYNASRFYQRVERMDTYYGRLLPRNFAPRHLPSGHEDPLSYPKQYREALDYVHYGGGTDTMVRQLYFCPADAPIALLLLPKAASTTGQSLAWRYESPRLKAAVLDEFLRKRRRIREHDRYKEAYEQTAAALKKQKHQKHLLQQAKTASLDDQQAETSVAQYDFRDRLIETGALLRGDEILKVMKG